MFCLFCKSVFLLGLANTKTCFLVSGAGARAQRRLRLAQNLSSRFCVCFFAGLNISLDLVEPIVRHRMELGVVALGLSLNLSSKRVAALARIAWKNESEKNETSVEQRTFACNSFHFFSGFLLYFVLLICVQTSII